MPRVCARQGCGKELLTENGNSDYRRHFCGSECKNADKRERMRMKRAKLKTERCPTCGRKPPGDLIVPRHEAPESFSQVPTSRE